MPSDEDKILPEPWRSFLRELDQIATETVSFHCIGGFVVTRYYGFSRETGDVDVLSITPNAQRQAFIEIGARGSALHNKYSVCLDSVTVIPAYPENYESRLIEMYPGQLERIRLFALEAHDLALTKLERNIERDREDVKYLARKGHINVEDLKLRYRDEMRPYIAIPEQRSDQTLELWIEMISEELSTPK